MRPVRFSILLLGDILVLGLITLFGFASHNELDSAGLRMFTTFIPLLAAWLLLSPHLKVFDHSQVSDWRQLWRPFWAMVLAAPLAAWMRGAWLNQPILPIFVVVLGGFTALGLLFWRGVYWFISSRLR